MMQLITNFISFAINYVKKVIIWNYAKPLLFHFNLRWLIKRFFTHKLCQACNRRGRWSEIEADNWAISSTRANWGWNISTNETIYQRLPACLHHVWSPIGLLMIGITYSLKHVACYPGNSLICESHFEIRSTDFYFLSKSSHYEGSKSCSIWNSLWCFDINNSIYNFTFLRLLKLINSVFVLITVAVWPETWQKILVIRLFTKHQTRNFLNHETNCVTNEIQNET